jgi:hypothetical protein
VVVVQQLQSYLAFALDVEQTPFLVFWKVISDGGTPRERVTLYWRNVLLNNADIESDMWLKTRVNKAVVTDINDDKEDD